MNVNPIDHIMCAVRGRPQSRDTATRAIDLALKHNARLTFVMVIDAEFMRMATPAMSRLRTIFNQLEAMSEFALLILTDRAERRGVQVVDSFVLKGSVQQELHKLASTTTADVLVIGRPDPTTAKSAFQPAEFEAFIADLQEHTGLEIVTVEKRPPDTAEGI